MNVWLLGQRLNQIVSTSFFFLRTTEGQVWNTGCRGEAKQRAGGVAGLWADHGSLWERQPVQSGGTIHTKQQCCSDGVCSVGSVKSLLAAPERAQQIQQLQRVEKLWRHILIFLCHLKNSKSTLNSVKCANASQVIGDKCWLQAKGEANAASTEWHLRCGERNSKQPFVSRLVCCVLKPDQLRLHVHDVRSSDTH